MKTALVTGHNGFVGRHMVKALEERGFRVRGLDITGPPLGSHRPVGLMDYLINRWSGKVYDLVVHCAYNVGGRAGIDGKNMNFARNVMLDGALFDWAVGTQQKAVMYFSSCAVYPALWQTIDPMVMHEDDLSFETFDWDDPLRPFDNYGWSKQTGERLALEAQKNGLRVHVLRPFSGYGEDQSLDYPFPSIIRRAAAGDLTVWGPFGQRRDFIHIDDVIEGALRVYEDDDRRPINLCTGVGTEMGELAVLAYDLGYKGMRTNMSTSMMVKYDESKPTGVFYRVGDASRMNEHYTAKVTIEEGVKRALM